MKKCCDMRGFLSYLVLCLIGRHPMSGEDLRKELEKRKGTRPSPGTIYPVLKSLHKNGFITQETYEGKEKRYTLTSLGKQELRVAKTKFKRMFKDL